MIRAWLLGLGLSLAAVAAAAQVRLSAGEHNGFTRVVLRLPPGLGWRLEGAGSERLFRPQSAQGFDLDTLFLRIPRTRLAEAEVIDGALRLALACDCDVRAWQERPGLVVLDISDPVAPGATGAAGVSVAMPVTAPPIPNTSIDPVVLARRAGVQLATEARLTQPESAGPDLDALDRVAGELGASMAAALSQGLLDAASPHANPTATLPSAPDAEADLPPNMRLHDATSRDNPAETEPDNVDLACVDAASLDFLVRSESSSFMDRRGALIHSLYGEFDQPSDTAHADLARLYLSAGFGAEARALLGALSGPLAGRDLLLGFADVLEGRMSNSRLRLAALAGCGDAATLAAILAGAPDEATAANAASATLAFGRAPAALRALVGADLAERLARAGALDAARIVADEIRRSTWATDADRAIVEAALPAALTPDRLVAPDDAPLRSADAMVAWLGRAVRDGTPVSSETLNDAIALALQQGSSAGAQAILEQVARLWLRSPTPQEALATLDLITESLPEGASRPDALIDEIWLGTATVTDDRTFLALMLMREDWRGAALSAQTRGLIAGRLRAQGLADAAQRLDPEWATQAEEPPNDRVGPGLADDSPEPGPTEPALPPPTEAPVAAPEQASTAAPAERPAAVPPVETEAATFPPTAPQETVLPPLDPDSAGPVSRAATLLSSAEELRALVAQTLEDR